MKHVPHAYETDIIGSCKVAGVVRKHTGEEIPTQQWAFSIQRVLTSLFHGRQGASIFFERLRIERCQHKRANKKPKNVEETLRTPPFLNWE